MDLRIASRLEQVCADDPLWKRLRGYSEALSDEQDDDMRRDALPMYLRPLFDDLLAASQALTVHEKRVAELQGLIAAQGLIARVLEFYPDKEAPAP